MKIAAWLSYNGAPFSGFARQNNQLTVQGSIEDALALLFRRPVETTCAGRTDSGVHALCQVVSFDLLEDEWTRRKPESFLKSLNALTHEDISVYSVRPMPESFSARFSAVSREYRYYICTDAAAPLLMKNFSWHIGRALDVEKMRQAAQYLIGEHDFKSFCMAVSAKGKPTQRYVAEVSLEEVEIWKSNFVVITVIGNAFLHSMVRTIVGTLCLVGTGKREPEWVQSVLEAKSRQAAGQNAPAQGLALWNVVYPPHCLQYNPRPASSLGEIETVNCASAAIEDNPALLQAEDEAAQEVAEVTEAAEAEEQQEQEQAEAEDQQAPEPVAPTEAEAVSNSAEEPTDESPAPAYAVETEAQEEKARKVPSHAKLDIPEVNLFDLIYKVDTIAKPRENAFATTGKLPISEVEAAVEQAGEVPAEQAEQSSASPSAEQQNAQAADVATEPSAAETAAENAEDAEDGFHIGGLHFDAGHKPRFPHLKQENVFPYLAQHKEDKEWARTFSIPRGHNSYENNASQPTSSLFAQQAAASAGFKADLENGVDFETASEKPAEQAPVPEIQDEAPVQQEPAKTSSTHQNSVAVSEPTGSFQAQVFETPASTTGPFFAAKETIHEEWVFEREEITVPEVPEEPEAPKEATKTPAHAAPEQPEPAPEPGASLEPAEDAEPESSPVEKQEREQEQKPTPTHASEPAHASAPEPTDGAEPEPEPVSPHASEPEPEPAPEPEPKPKMNLPVVEVPPVEKPVNSTPTEPFPTVLSAATARQRRRAKQAAEKRAFTRKKRSQ